MNANTLFLMIDEMTGILFYGGSLLAAAFYLLGFAESLVGKSRLLC